eukprot:1635944-Prymnesium_polylepis.1
MANADSKGSEAVPLAHPLQVLGHSSHLYIASCSSVLGLAPCAVPTRISATLAPLGIGTRRPHT